MAPHKDEIGFLIVAAGRGDRAAFRRLYLATSAKLLGLVTRITKSRAEAEEVVQEVYLKAWTNAASFSPDSGTGMGWLVSISRNRAIDLVRAKTAAATEAQETEWFDKLVSDQNLEAEIMDRTALVKCLATLEPAVRDMIVLAYVDGLSREELAERFGMPVNTVKTRLHRGLGALKSCLDEKS
ncbi:MAG: sigma-70 family RNA polymerase sigma factor [Hyphomicrobiales bacterium]|nr:sigma-70 family RNA polymerase sigma factor [Hyphomicrobiales bacterium]